MPYIHHPKLLREARVGASAVKGYVRDGGWKEGPLTDAQREEARKKAEAKNKAKKPAAKKTASS
jgi:hypothetical protein